MIEEQTALPRFRAFWRWCSGHIFWELLMVPTSFCFRSPKTLPNRMVGCFNDGSYLFDRFKELEFLHLNVTSSSLKFRETFCQSKLDHLKIDSKKCLNDLSCKEARYISFSKLLSQSGILTPSDPNYHPVGSNLMPELIKQTVLNSSLIRWKVSSI